MTSDDNRRALTKRDAVLQIIHDFKCGLHQVSGERAHARDLALTARELLVQVQGESRDIPFLTRSICQMAMLLRKSGSPGVGVELLAWAEARTAADAYSFCEYAECYLACGDSEKAVSVLRDAIHRGYAASGVYLSLVKVYVRRCERVQAEQAIVVAEQAGLLNSYMLNLVLESHWRAGDLIAAERLFAKILKTSPVSEDAFVTMIKMYAKAGRIETAADVFLNATNVGLHNSRLYAAVISAYGTCGDLKRMEETFAEGRRRGLLDHRLYAAMIRGYGVALCPKEATRIFTEAKRNGHLNDWVVAAAVEADFRSARYSQARKKYQQARKSGLATPAVRPRRPTDWHQKRHAVAERPGADSPRRSHVDYDDCFRH
jgi:pentatricopeptide repeat protein